MRMSDREILSIAHRIRPHITPYLEDHGFVSDAALKTLAKAHTGHQVTSERTLAMIQAELMEC